MVYLASHKYHLCWNLAAVVQLAAAKLDFMYCNIVLPNTAGVT